MYGLASYGRKLYGRGFLNIQTISSITTPSSSRNEGINHLTGDRTNLITNPTASGAVVGNPGTDPTGWSRQVVAGTTLQVSAAGSGYVQYLLGGTSTTSGTIKIMFGPLIPITDNNQQFYFTALVTGPWFDAVHTPVFRLDTFLGASPALLSEVTLHTTDILEITGSSLPPSRMVSGQVSVVFPGGTTPAYVQMGLMVDIPNSGISFNSEITVGNIALYKYPFTLPIAEVSQFVRGMGAVRVAITNPVSIAIHTVIKDMVAITNPVSIAIHTIIKPFVVFPGVMRSIVTINITRALTVTALINFVEQAVRTIALPRSIGIIVPSNRVLQTSIDRKSVVNTPPNILLIKTLFLHAVITVTSYIVNNPNKQINSSVNVSPFTAPFSFMLRRIAIVMSTPTVNKLSSFAKAVAISIISSCYNTVNISPYLNIDVTPTGSKITTIISALSARVMQATIRSFSIFTNKQVITTPVAACNNMMAVFDTAMVLMFGSTGTFKFRDLVLNVDAWVRGTDQIVPGKNIEADITPSSTWVAATTKTVRAILTPVSRTLNNTLLAPFRAVSAAVGYLARSIGRDVHSDTTLVGSRQSVIGWDLVTVVGVNAVRDAAISISRLAVAVAFLVSRVQAHLIRTYTVSPSEGPVLEVSVADEVEAVGMASSDQLVVRLTVQEIAP